LKLPYSGPSNQWTVVHVDLAKTLEGYTSRRYKHLKGIQLCANLLVRSVIVTDLILDDPSTHPREMRLFVPNGEAWADRYQLVRFPPSSPNGTDARSHDGAAVDETLTHAPKSRNSKPTARPMADAALGDERDMTVMALPPPLPPADPVLVADAAALSHTYSVVRHATSAAASAPQDRAAAVTVTPASTLPAVGLDLPHLNPLADHAAIVRGNRRAKGGLADDMSGAGFAHGNRRGDGAAGDGAAGGATTTTKFTQLEPTASTLDGEEASKSHALSALLDSAPMLALGATIGYSSTAPGGVAWAADPHCVVYACHRVIVLLDTETRAQRLLLGHTAKIEAMAVDSAGGCGATRMRAKHGVVVKMN
jgi:hypothetical protein